MFGPDLYEIVEVVVEKNSGHCRPSKVLRCVAVVSRVLVVCLVITCLRGVRDTTCARAQQRIERLGGPIQMLV